LATSIAAVRRKTVYNSSSHVPHIRGWNGEFVRILAEKGLAEAVYAECNWKKKWGVETRRGIHGMLTLLQVYISDEWLGEVRVANAGTDSEGAWACADEHPFVDTIEITNASLGLVNACL
jgi:hypothetical protein